MKFTSEDLLKAMGLKIGDKINLGKSRFEILNRNGNIICAKCDESPFTYAISLFNLVDSEYTIIQPKPTLTEDEKVILRNLDKKYKYIAKDNYEEKEMENDLVLFAYEPTKNIYWFEVSVENTDSVYFSGFNHLFKFIKPMDCYSIEELLKEN